MKRYGLLVVICSSLGLLFFIYIFYSRYGRFPSPQVEAIEYLTCMLATNLAGLIAYQMDRFLDRWIHWRRYFLPRFLSGFILNIMVVLSLMISVHIFWLETQADDITKLGILLAISIFIYEIFYGLFFSYHYYAITQVEQMKADRLQLELQFESLKMQISPHYLFNCLNTVSSLLFKDTVMAEQFIRRMAETFRFVFDNQKRKLISVREEVEFVKAYYYLLQVRYEHHLSLEINVPKNVLDTWIPPMTLQLLAENAVKHNIISKEHPLLIYISARDNTHLIISNSKTMTEKGESFQVGLNNITSRYRFFSSEKIVINNDARFTVILPVIKRNTKEENSVHRSRAQA